MVSKIPAGIVAHRAMAHTVRQVALELGLSYEEKPVSDRDDAVRFVFEPLDEEMSRKLAFAVPRDAYYFKGVFVGGIS